MLTSTGGGSSGRSIGGRNGKLNASRLNSNSNSNEISNDGVRRVRCQKDDVRKGRGGEGNPKIIEDKGGRGSHDRIGRGNNDIDDSVRSDSPSVSLQVRRVCEEAPRGARPVNRPQVYSQRGSNNRVRDQQRAARWRVQQPTIISENKRTHKRGATKLMAELAPTHEQILAGMKMFQSRSDESEIAGGEMHNSEAQEIYTGLTDEDDAIRELLEQWKGGAHGYVPEVKEDDIIRLACENVNSLSIYHKGTPKIGKLLNLNNRHQTDGICIVEHGVNFGHYGSNIVKRPQEIFASIKGSRTSAGYNKHENFSRYMAGGTMVSTFSRLSSFVMAQGVDSTGLGRWSWILVGSGDHRTIIVSAYQPQKSSNKPRLVSADGKMIRGGTVAAQHRRYFRSRGNCKNPRELFTSQLIIQLKVWTAKGYEIILFADLNENIYTGPFSLQLQHHRLLMDEQTLKSTGERAPYSHQSGKRPIVGTFATPGILCVNSYLSPHGTGVGDHRFQLHDFDAISVLGIEYPKLVKPTGRSLRSSNPKARKKYTKILKRRIAKHRINEKLSELHICRQTLSKSIFQQKFNKWDKEVTQLMLGSEKGCNQFYNGTIEFSPLVGIYIRRLRVYRWIKRFQSGKKTTKKTLWRTCKRMKIPSPIIITPVEVQNTIDECMQKLEDLKRQSPKLREEHLAARLAAAKKEKKKAAIVGITKIIRKEASRKRWRRIGNCIRPQRGSAISRVAVDHGSGEIMYATREGVETNASDAIAQRYLTARSAPILQNQDLHSDFGFLADTEATRQVLQGNYVYPESIENYTRLLLQEAHEIFMRLPQEEVKIFLSEEEFRYYWRYVAKADTQSSASGVHFEHYITASYDKELSTLQAAKLSLAAATGTPLDRWSKGITVLLEKVPGSTNISSFRAICLFEADLNYLNKFVYAKQMMNNALTSGIVPAEQFAKRGSQANQGVITSGLFCDIVRTLNKKAAVQSVDLANCYDAIAHPIVSIALQSFKVNRTMVAMTLLVLQVTAWHLRTTFGLSERSFGGTQRDPSMGLGQGNGMAPPGFTAMSTLMINAYKSLGNGVDLHSAWSGMVFVLAAVIFVDDSDLLHMADSLSTDEEFSCKIQRATDDWAGIVCATGGSLKPKKCFWYMLSPVWKNGIPQLKTLSQLPTTSITIPQPDGTRVAITLKDPRIAEKKLGVYFAPNGDFTSQVEYMVKSGLHHASCLKSHPLRPREARMSVDLALMPKMLYGAVAVSHSPGRLEEAFQKVYFNLLPFLGVNRNITKEYRMLPQQYQGLGLPNPNIEVLSAKLQLIREYWDSDTTMGKMLTQSYQVFQIELGLGGNIFDKPYNALGHLATDVFFRNLWELLDKYGVSLRIHKSFDIPLLRVNDRMMMDAIQETAIFTTTELGQINRVRHYKKVSSVADLVCCDGRSISTDMYTTEVGESKWEFPIQQPTAADFAVWKKAIGSLVRTGNKLLTTLGEYINNPHKPDVWFINEIGTEIYHKTATGLYEHYGLNNSSRTTRFGAKFTLKEPMIESPALEKRLTPSHWTGNEVCYHSVSAVKPFQPTAQRTMLEIIQAQENKSLWNTLRIDGEDGGKWIHTSFMKGTLAVGHDGSYQQELATDICAGSAVLFCTSTEQYAELTWVEKSDRKTATNYRGEILGAIAAQLLLKFAVEGYEVAGHKPLRIGCDNMGVVKHGNDPKRPLTEKQCQADLLRFLKHLIGLSRVGGKLRHVHAHCDKYTNQEDMTLDQRINVRADEIVGKALTMAIKENRFITSVFPLEKVVIQVAGTRVSGSPKAAILELWGEHVARNLFHRRKVVHSQIFPMIYWEGMLQVMKTFPVMFRTWITKQVSHFNGTNRQISRWDEKVINVCPNCNCPDESTNHINRCPDPGRRSIMKKIGKRTKKMDDE